MQKFPKSGCKVINYENIYFSSPIKIYFFKLFPHKETHDQEVVDFFGANDSGLATYDTMFHSIKRDSTNKSLVPVADSVNMFNWPKPKSSVQDLSIEQCKC